ncbi:hypothetical protein DFA_05925 [Cavenderia fasciculata]|uniref:Acid ceramidase-like protein n=1 Tax=Cavenderia fasciculata TaxID=261658 RepID=F4PJL5_CACFS|nr:uncharacterized protein DFA_05925 [Cavenderia fasciculata]EGG23789.1 hypothetical protein DFA_05925 [Cavenderia fasciculata]|eukprot:XP_004361640.1 hypothetical protein DFA_05925 [Cavenderia fasciculata]
MRYWGRGSDSKKEAKTEMRFITITLAVLVASIFFLSLASIGVEAFCKGTSNRHGIIPETPMLVSKTANGKLFLAGSQETGIPVVHLYGTPYQMGLAHGTLLKDKIQFAYKEYIAYFVAGAESLPLPEWQKILIKFGGINTVLDGVVNKMKPHIPQHYLDEMKGLADGSGITEQEVLRFHMIPELIRASCSMMGAWNDASPSGGLVQLRALDWDYQSPLTLVPAIFVYHPTEGGHEFTTVSWAGFIGSLTGYSGHMGVSEKVWSNYNGTFSEAGTPFYFVMRDILQFDITIDEAINRIQYTQRTCAVYMGIGANITNQFVAVEYSHDYVQVFDDITPFPIYSPQYAPHELFEGVVYIDPDYASAQTQCFTKQIKKYYGYITSTTIQQMTSVMQTGNLHAAIYDYQNNILTVGYASPNVTWPLTVNPIPAYARGMIELDVTALFNEQY